MTGGYSGIGTAVTRGLSDAGATVVVPARRPDQARKVIGGVAGVEIAELDLADLGSVERFAGDFLASDRGVDMLINNAAVMANDSSDEHSLPLLAAIAAASLATTKMAKAAIRRS